MRWGGRWLLKGHSICSVLNASTGYQRNSFLKEQKYFKQYFEDKPQCNFKEIINNDSKKFLHKLKEKPRLFKSTANGTVRQTSLRIWIHFLQTRSFWQSNMNCHISNLFLQLLWLWLILQKLLNRLLTKIETRATVHTNWLIRTFSLTKNLSFYFFFPLQCRIPRAKPAQVAISWKIRK